MANFSQIVSKSKITETIKPYRRNFSLHIIYVIKDAIVALTKHEIVTAIISSAIGGVLTYLIIKYLKI